MAGIGQSKYKYIQGLFPALVTVQDKDLHSKVVQAWCKAWDMSQFKRIEDLSQWEPEKEKINITNVMHTNLVTNFAMHLANRVNRNYGQEINKDVLTAACLLHDIDKLLMFEAQGGKLTRIGRLYLHTHIGAQLISMMGLPQEVVHCVAAHSKRYSTMQPQTLEAKIVKLADEFVTEKWLISINQAVSFRL